MRWIAGTIGLVLGVLAAGCGGPSPPEPRTSLATDTATTASASSASSAEPPAGSTGPTSAAGPATSASRPAGSTSKTTRKPPPPAKSTPTTAKPPAKGSPVRTAPIDIVGSSYAQTGPLTKAELADECGGTLCVTVADTVEGPPDPDLDCKVKRIIQQVPIYRGDTITVVLADPCGDFTEPSPTTG
ncbi:hypothetical protein AB0F15_23115 [Amycolatopsis sp. NPDC026612]|uniref:hypothetical protein n=1 Tax=Amycolatopsis sp. NPDC026612 TaxID=3155466 RepID=UPI0033C8DBB3